MNFPQQTLLRQKCAPKCGKSCYRNLKMQKIFCGKVGYLRPTYNTLQRKAESKPDFRAPCFSPKMASICDTLRIVLVGGYD